MHIQNGIQESISHLHITNDTNTAQKLREAGIPGDMLPWQDALYEGPVIDSDDINEVSNKRAEYFSRVGWGVEQEIKHRFTHRNQIVQAFPDYREITLWFDHDLYDQLQIMQIITWFAKQNMRGVILNLICIDQYPGVKHFMGISQLATDHLKQLFQARSEVTMSQVRVCGRGWKAFTSPNPNALLAFFPQDMSSMPFLRNAIARLVKQFPCQSNGLSQSEHFILTAVLNHQNDPEDIYQTMQSKEAVPFMSRAMFYGYLKKLMNCRAPLIEEQVTEVVMEDVIEGEIDNATSQQEDQTFLQLQLTETARQVLHNWVDWVQVNGIDRWIGGVHLSEGNIWRYNKQSRRLVKTYL